MSDMTGQVFPSRNALGPQRDEPYMNMNPRAIAELLVKVSRHHATEEGAPLVAISPGNR